MSDEGDERECPHLHVVEKGIETSSPSKPITVLYVDDDPEFIRFFKIFLESTSSFHVITATSGPEVLDEVSRGACDVIVSDYQMPGMNGIQLLQKVRVSSTLPFILFTGKGREEVVMDAINNGATFYLQKSGDPQTLFAELVHKIKAAVGNWRAELALREREEELSRKNSELSAAYEELLATEEERCVYLRELEVNQKKIRESEQRYRELTDLLPLIVYECDLKGFITYVNRQGFLTFDYPEGPLPPGFNVVDLIVPEDRPRAFENMAKIPLSGTSAPHEYYVYKQDRSIIPVLIYSSPIIKEGDVVGFRGIVLDISEQKRSEKEIRESERRLANVIDFLPDATFVIDRQGTVIAWNRAMEQFTGYPAGDILGKGDYTYAIPFYGTPRPILIDLALKNDEEAEKNYSSISRNGETVVGEASMVTLDGNTRYLWGASSPLRDSQGEIVGAIESIRDITEWKLTEEELVRSREELERRVNERTAELTRVNSVLRSEIEDRTIAENALRESQDRYRRLVDLSPDAIFVHDGKDVLFINPAGTRLLGIGQSLNTAGMNMSEFIHQDLLEKFRSLIQEPENQANFPLNAEEEFFRIDHSKVTVEVSSAPILFQGSPAALIVARDITGRKRAEEQLKRYAAEMADKNKELDYLANQMIEINQDLDRRVKERTEQVLKLMKQKDDFITQLGHDLKTPLTPLRALLPALIEEEENPTTKEALAVLLRSVYSIQEQTEKILTIARLSREDIEVKPEPVLIRPIILESLQKHRIYIQKKELDISVEIPEYLSLFFSPSDAGTVFDNLIGNAVKYSAIGGSVWIRSYRDGDKACVLVGDDGIGLSEEEKNHVFDEFYMADSSRHDRSSSGLGLAIVRRLVRLYNGLVWVESEGKGKGAIFFVCLPAPVSIEQ
ncbi:MAG TPA: PAS domain S-box protein [Methanospirillum sp.]|uniref:PAS domain S-box protein n=1 Tax=Methanospirillum sp. TaxID=45200 RepID=UPI002CF931E1|nr:PAS domain S-box protein [Methanospirillum sp.]HWQ64126.1 PAS domain S-box protein [Methanospirillum sp.]